MNDDDESLSLSSLGTQRRPALNTGEVPSVPMTVTMIGCTENNKKRRTSVSTCLSTCSSSVASGRRRDRNRSPIRTTEQDIIAHLREELEYVKAESVEKVLQAREEAENSRILAQKLIEENAMIRQEANDAHARADRLEEEIRKLSSPAAAIFSRTWRNATKAMRTLQVDASNKKPSSQVASDAKVSDVATVSCSPNNDVLCACKANVGLKKEDRPMVSVEVPVEGEASTKDRLSSTKSFRRMLRGDASAPPKKPVVSKLVTAEALLWESFDCPIDLDLLENSLSSIDLAENRLSSHQRINANLAGGRK